MQNFRIANNRSSAMCTGPYRFGKALAVGFMAVLGLGCLNSVSAQTIPAAVAITSKTVVATVNGNAGRVSMNTLGDTFYVSQTDNTAYWLPRGATMPIALVTGLSGGRSVYVDSANNVYVPSNYDGRVIEIPFIKGTYVTGTANSGNLPVCGSTSPTVPCQQFNNGTGATGYYLQATDLTFDAAGNAYVVDERDNICNQANAATTCNTILKFTPNSGIYTASVVVTGLPQNNSGQITSDPSGDLYYADGSNVYFIAAGAKTDTMIGTGLKTPGGVTSDQYGNVYISDSGNNRIVELPALNGVAQPSKQFTFSYTYTANSIGFDTLGDFAYTGYSSTTNINIATLYGFSLGSATVGKASTTSPTVTFTFTGSYTPAAFTVSGPGFSIVPGGTCAPATAYVSGNNCTVQVAYTPTAVGLQHGAINVTSATGANIATAFLSGIGLGAEQTNDPGTVTPIGSGWVSPQGIAVDNAGNVYVADPGQNAVLRYAVGGTTPTSIGTGLANPNSVAVDGAGDVYIADSGNNRVVLVPSVAGTLVNGSQTTVYTAGTGISLAVALDQKANLYIAEDDTITPTPPNTSRSTVIEIRNVGGIPNTGFISTIGSSFMAPAALATDSTGNLFVADTTAGTVQEITYYGKSQIGIGSGYSHPSGLATDASGSLYIADTGNSRLIKIPNETAGFNPNDEYPVGATVATPYGVALDATANLYVTDSADASVSLITRTQGTLNLGRSNLGVTTSPLNADIADAGNQSLMFGNPDYTATGDTTAFTVTSPSTGGCTSSETLLPAYGCILSATFDPPAKQTYMETLSFSSNAANTAMPQILLTGVGLFLANTSITLQQTAPAGNASLGQPVTITAMITSTTAGTPTGTVSFTVDGTPQTPASNVAANGTATIVLNGLTGGQHTIGATYSGDNNYAPSSGALTIIATKASTSSSLALGGASSAQNPASGVPGQPQTLTLTIVPNGSPAPTGTVNFYVGSTLLGTSTIQTQNNKAPIPPTYFSTFTTSVLPPGTDAITATYSGDVNYTSSSAALTVIISPATFTLTPANASLTVASGGTAATNLQVTSLSGFTAYVGLTCSGLPANTSCAFSPNDFVLQANNLLQGPPEFTASLYGPQVVTLEIITGETPGIPQPPVGGLFHAAGRAAGIPLGLAFFALAPLCFLVRRKCAQKLRRAATLFIFVLLLGSAVTLFSGCGSGLAGVTPKGTYNVVVTAASASPDTGTPTVFISQTTQITLTVQ